MHPELRLIAGQQHIADLHRAADRERLVHAATTAGSSQAATASHRSAATPVTFVRRLRRRLGHAPPGGTAIAPRPCHPQT
jgi:hypothetical protein